METKEAIKKYQGKCYHGDFEGRGLVWVQIMKVAHPAYHSDMWWCYANVLLCNYDRSNYRLRCNFAWFINDDYIEKYKYNKISFNEFLKAIDKSGCSYDFYTLTEFYGDLNKQRAKKILNYETE